MIFNDIESLNIESVKKFLQKSKASNFELYNLNSYNKERNIIEESDILYLDPPYDHDLNFLKENIFNRVSPNCLIILESNQKLDYSEILLEKVYKNKILYFIKKII